MPSAAPNASCGGGLVSERDRVRPRSASASRGARAAPHRRRVRRARHRSSAVRAMSCSAPTRSSVASAYIARARSGEERGAGRARLLGDHVERPQLALHRDDVEALPSGGQPPQVRGEAKVGVQRRARRPRRGAPPGSLVRRSRRVPNARASAASSASAVTSGTAISAARRWASSAKRRGARRVAAVDPRARERRGETAPRRDRLGRGVRLEEQRRDLARVHTEALAGGQGQRRSSHGLAVARRPRRRRTPRPTRRAWRRRRPQPAPPRPPPGGRRPRRVAQSRRRRPSRASYGRRALGYGRNSSTVAR